MNTTGIYKRTGIYAVILLAGSCNFTSNKKMNERMTLWRKDKIPYGTYYAFQNLHTVFPDATITINKASPAKYDDFTGVASYNKGNTAAGRSKKAYVIIASQVVPDENELNAMMDFVGSGNHIFISAFRFGDSLLKRVKIRTAYEDSGFIRRDSLALSVRNPVTFDSLAFVYPGRSADSYVSSMDSEYCTILGRDVHGRPDFVRFDYKGGGTLYLHLAPLAFTNFFLLHKNNKDYYDNVFSYLPASVIEVKWDDYFRYPGRGNFSAFRYIFSSPPLYWVFWLLLLLFLCIYLIESKRRQRMVPVIIPLKNSSLDFVKTIGRLYFQRRDNSNLASKMAAHFMDYARTRYNMPHSLADEEFVSRLSFKSGFDQQELNTIVQTIKSIQMNPWVSDEELLAFNKKVEAFYTYA